MNITSKQQQWSAIRPTHGGKWLWSEAGRRDPVELQLTSDGSQVAEATDTDKEGEPQFYWEQTPTDQRTMPGTWTPA